MAKYSKTATKVAPNRGPAKAVAKTVTHNGAPAFSLDDKSALFFLAATSLGGEKTYYESGQARDQRLIELVHSVTKSDPEWVERFVPYLRNEMNMRTASIIVAAEYIQAGGKNGRKVINAAMSRADEPAEFLGYWMQNYYGWDGRSFPLPAPKLPQPVRKGLSDAVRRLYTQKALLKWNGNTREIGFGNVLNLIHAAPEDDIQGQLFRYAVNRHHGNELEIGEGLDVVRLNRELIDMPDDERKAVLDAPWKLRKAGFTWEQLSGWLGGPMDAKAWEAMIEAGMGYMALLRNLRNFDQAKISKEYRQRVIDKLTNPDEVASSRQFPFRFYSAYTALDSLHYVAALEEALDLSVRNIPSLPGKTLVLTDVSGSMGATVSDKSKVQLFQVGAVFAAAMAYGQESGANFVAFGTGSREIELPKGGSVLKAVAKVDALFNDYHNGIGHGTNMLQALKRHDKGHDRIVIFSDMQASRMGNWMGTDHKVIHAFDLAGYNRTPFEIGAKGRYQYGGFTDKTFPLMKSLETVQSGNWPF